MKRTLRWCPAPFLPRRLPGAAVVLAIALAACDDPVPLPVPTTVTLSPPSAELAAVAATVQLAATVKDQNGNAMPDAAVTWSSGATGVATVDARGLVTAAGNGKATIRATAGPASGTAAVTVEQIPAAVALAPDSLTLSALGDTATLAATVTDANGHAIENAGVEWQSGDTAVAAVGRDGVVTAVGNGRGRITATAGPASRDAAVTVEQVAAAVALAPDSLTLSALGDTATLAATVTDANGHAIENAGVEWQSGDTTVAAVGRDGVVTAVGNGRGRITATAGPASRDAAVTVEQVAAAVALAPDSLTLSALGDTATLAATVTDANGHAIENAGVEWKSGDTTVAAVGRDGVVTAVGNGRGRITATAGPASGDAAVTVEQVAAAVALAPDSLIFPALGDTATLAATVTDANGHAIENAAVEWESGDTAVASVDARGLVTASGSGQTGITATAGAAEETARIIVHTDRAVLVAFYNATGGDAWRNNGGWLSEQPLSQWHGVHTDARGYVTWLWLSDNDLTGSIPPELGQLAGLQRLYLYRNYLKGPIPPELGQLAGLQRLYLNDNDLTGSIPPELGQLARLQHLWLDNNDLTGSIPRELGQLASLQRLYLYRNYLKGPIPPELGQLAGLQRLYLSDNNLTGSIPRELGQLASLQHLYLYGNDLTGTIPPELGRLADLVYLLLGGNGLTGPIPPGLGKLNGLQRLNLRNNDLTGSIPAELGKLASLEELHVEHNAGMTGALPSAMTALTKLRSLWAVYTGLCAMSDDEAVRKWLDGIPRKRIDSCNPGAVYLTQAVQTRHQHETVPLVAAEKALLRVFLVAAKKTDEHIPDVRATFYVGGRRVKEIDVPGKATAIPTEVDEGDLSKSANAEVPGATVQPGLEVVVEVDSVDASLGIPRRIPATGRLKIPVDSVPVFKLTLIPFLYDADPDSSIIDTVDDMAEDPEDHNLFRDTRTLLPVESLDVTAHAPVEIDSDRGLAVLRATDALRVAEGGSGYYKGMMPSFSDVGGVAYVGGWSSASRTNNGTIAHELGHSMSLRHAPCGGAGGVDPLFPDKDGRIGSWGYDFAAKRVVSPRTPDLMSYCGPEWISAYHLDKAFDHRVNDEGGKTGPPPPPRAPARSLLLWGGTGPDGQPYLEPVFVMDAPPALPADGGDHRLRGLDAAGGELFSLPFDMPEIADGDGSSAFAFALPADPGWAESLASVTLSGPGGSVTLDGDGDRPTAILRDPRTGEIRAILRDTARAQALAATLNADVLFSRGIPDADAWRR